MVIILCPAQWCSSQCKLTDFPAVQHSPCLSAVAVASLCIFIRVVCQHLYTGRDGIQDIMKGGSCYCAHFTQLFSSTLPTFGQPCPFQLCLLLNRAAARKTTYSHNIKNHWYTPFFSLEARGQRGSNEPNKLPHGSATDQFNTPWQLIYS